MPIEPVSIPSGAGIDYASGDVRHLSVGDSLDVPGISNPTRELAQRDNILAAKVNEVVGVINNQEQFVPLPIPRTIVSPGDSIVAANYRIPAGFEARVLNAIVSASPSSTDAELDIYYDQGFGGSTGQAIVSVTSAVEFTGEISFYQTGEFVIVLSNKGASTLEIAVSVMLTMRPLGTVGSLLVGTTVSGPPGQPGMTGPPGIQGPAGTGAAGAPGVNFTGPWIYPNNYNPKDAVYYSSSGTNGTWITGVAHTSSLANAPGLDTTWQPMALGYNGTFSGTTTVTTSGSVPNYFTHLVSGTLITGSDWVGLAINGYNAAGIGANTTTLFNCNESYIESATNNLGFNRGFAVLSGIQRLAFAGNGTFILPNAAKGNWTTSNASVLVDVHGTVPGIAGGIATTVSVVPVSSTNIVVKNFNGQPLWLEISMTGATTY